MNKTLVTSTSISSPAYIVGYEKAVELVAKAGFEAWDFSMFDMCRFDSNRELIKGGHPLRTNEYLKFARQLKKIGEDNGIFCNQSHAPFPSMAFDRKYLLRAIECTAEAGGKICVIHPDNNSSPEKNAEMYLEILPFAKQCGVKIATENMWNWDGENECSCAAACSSLESFKANLDAVNDDFFVACVDIGHAEMRPAGPGAAKLIKHLGDKVQALHIHDVDLTYDNHQIPFSLKVDYAPIAKALKEINYKGEFTLEADAYLGGRPADKVLDGLKDLQKSVRKFADMFEAE